MLIVMVTLVYLCIGATLVFGVARKELFEVINEDSLVTKIGLFAFWLVIAPVAFVYGFIKEALKN